MKKVITYRPVQKDERVFLYSAWETKKDFPILWVDSSIGGDGAWWGKIVATLVLKIAGELSIMEGAPYGSDPDIIAAGIVLHMTEAFRLISESELAEIEPN